MSSTAVHPERSAGASAGGGPAASAGPATFCLKHACATERGGRPYQEDRYVAIRDLNPAARKAHGAEAIDASVRRSYFAVFDGHGGDHCARWAARELPRRCRAVLTAAGGLPGMHAMPPQ